ncbi:hypothetical protein ES319_A10G228300v1 [Gossypium barbadense]|uniref:Dirigent protein n=2 Tax=Gossypium TaxID=3633 RepID=A0A5J5U7I3_GOSBA|nr:hypothetical protein ES319_A10G228300v1 [Gossypium barbadense]TYH00213.1 hypothetical protein ES288_A10G256300v1 [Gossypium darwinii]
MANLSCFSTLLFSLLFIVKNTSSARNLENPSSNHHHHHDHHHKISFSMPDLLNISHPTTSTLNTPIPFSKPIGFFPPHKGIPIQEPVPKIPGSDSSVQTLSGSNLGMFFPARATLQELEFGAVVTIDANLFDGGIGTNGSPLGKAQGVYVASSEGETSHMMAMTTVFADGGFKDGLRFFGLHRRDVSESHIAVIGGMGKYVGANGYATVKGVELRPNSAMTMKQGVNKLLLFNVYLS